MPRRLFSESRRAHQALRLNARGTNPPASLALTALGILHEIFRHAGHVRSLEEAAEERGQRQEQVVRSILVWISESSLTMVLAAGPAQIS